MSKSFGEYKPLAPARFRSGEMVLWNPPLGVYSPQSAQRQERGRVGMMMGYHSDDIALVMFAHRGILCNAAYLEKASV